MRSFGAISVLLMSLLAAASDSSESAGLREFRIADAVVFSGPSDLVDPGGIAADAVAGVLENEMLVVEYDYGRYSSDLREFTSEGVAAAERVVDGRPARLIETPQLIAIHVRDVRAGLHLTLLIYTRTAAARTAAQALLDSVRFLPPASRGPG